VSAVPQRLSLSVPLGDVVSEALAAEAAIAERKGVRLQADAGSDWPIVHGSDPELARGSPRLIPAASGPATTAQAAASRSNSHSPPAHPTPSETRPRDQLL
jgi:hypothetical protein